MIASAPGKLLLCGEYAVLDGAPAVVVAVDRRAIARRGGRAAGSPFLDAVAAELAARGAHAAAAIARDVGVDSATFYEGGRKLGLGSSAAALVAALALGAATHARAGASDPAAAHDGAGAGADRVFAIARAAHARAPAPRGARGSGADIAAAVFGGTIVFTAGRVERRRWPASVTLVPFAPADAMPAADTAQLVAAVTAARADDAGVEAALAAIAGAARAVAGALAGDAPAHAGAALLAAFAAAAAATDQLAAAARLPLVPACVTAARVALAQLGGTAKTTGAGGGGVGVALLPADQDLAEATRRLVEAGCRVLALRVDAAGVDFDPLAQ